MPWFKVDDDLSFHRKVVTSGNAAMGLWVRAGSWCAQHLTDGFVPNEMISILGTPAQRAKLVKSRLWIEVDGGCQFHEWNENGRQPTSQSVREQRSAAATRQAKWRANKSADPQVNESRNGVTEPFVTQEVTEAVTPTPTRPDPIPTSNEVGIKTRSRASRSGDATPDRFDEFWALYPNRVKKDDARKVWAAVLRKKVDPDHVLAALTRQVEAWRAEGREKKYIPHPTSWLRAGRYDDELEQGRLTLVPPHVPADPSGAFNDLRTRAAALEAARLIGVTWVEPPQRPSDTTPPQQWSRDRAVEFIDDHRAELLSALTNRKTG